MLPICRYIKRPAHDYPTRDDAHYNIMNTNDKIEDAEWRLRAPPNLYAPADGGVRSPYVYNINIINVRPAAETVSDIRTVNGRGSAPVTRPAVLYAIL